MPIYSDNRENRIDLICQHTTEGKIIPLKIRLKDEDGEQQEFTVRGYREASEFPMLNYECVIVVRDTKKTIKIFSPDGLIWHIKR